MADKKISELTALTGANVATDDQLVIVDTSAALTKNITIDEFKNALDTATGFVRITGDTMTGDLSMGDNVKAIFGAGSDLQIYHDSNHSYIQDTGTGELRLLGTNLKLKNGTNDATYLTASNGGAVTISHNNDPKLATTSTGIDVTGTVTADIVQSSSTGSASAPAYSFDSHTTAGFYRPSGLGSSIGVATSGAQRALFSNNGDISFYDSLGSSQSFFWDASAESLGIGTSSPSAPLDIEHGTDGQGINVSLFSTTQSNGPVLRLAHSLSNTVGTQTAVTVNDTLGKILFAGSDGSSFYDGAAIIADASQNFTGTAGGTRLEFYTTDSGTQTLDQRMVIDQDGSVGIGTTSPIGLAHLSQAGGADSMLVFENTSGTNPFQVGQGNDDSLRFYYNASEKMRIDSSGNLLISGTNTTPNTNSAGTTADNEMALRNDGLALFSAYKSTANDGVVMDINRTSTDGGILGFRKDGTTVGSIESRGGVATNLILRTATGQGAGIGGANSGVLPCDEDGLQDDEINLGASGTRWNDLWLSGGVYLGGTGSANKLNDYEYGFFEPTFGGTSTNPSGVTYDPTVGNEGYYVKIGRAVFVQINIRTDAISNVGSGNLFIQGLPFAAAAVSGQGGVGSFAVSQSTAFGGEAPNAGCVSEGLSYISLFYRTGASAGSIASECSDLRTIANSNLIRLSGTYYSTD